MERNLQDGRIDRHLVFGLVLILIGMMLTLDRGWLIFSGTFWPFVVLLFAAAKLIDPPTSPSGITSRRGGAWLLFIGVWGLVNEFHLFGLEYSSSWPFIIVGVGIMMVWGAMEKPAAPRADVR